MKKPLDKRHKVWYNSSVLRKSADKLKKKKNKKSSKKLLTNRSTYGIIKLQKDKDSPKNQKGIDTMAIEKVTVRSQFEAVKAVLIETGHSDLADFIDGRIAQTVKKNTAPRKPTAKQVENEGFKSDILAWMDTDTVYSAGDVLKGVPSVVASGMSINRVSALLTQLAESGALVKSVDKRKNYYSLV